MVDTDPGHCHRSYVLHRDLVLQELSHTSQFFTLHSENTDHLRNIHVQLNVIPLPPRSGKVLHMERPVQSRAVQHYIHHHLHNCGLSGKPRNRGDGLPDNIPIMVRPDGRNGNSSHAAPHEIHRQVSILIHGEQHPEREDDNITPNVPVISLTNVPGVSLTNEPGVSPTNVPQ